MTDYLEEWCKTSVFDYKLLENTDVLSHIELYSDLFELNSNKTDSMQPANKVSLLKYTD